MVNLVQLSKSTWGTKRLIAIILMLSLMACTSESKTSNTSAYFSLSGKVSVKSQTSLDSDVIERNSNFIDKNNTETNAQSITNPISIGGYISGRLIEYVEDDVKFSIDDVDIYSVALLKSQTISLSAYYADDDNLDNSLDLTLKLKRIVNDTSEVVSSILLDSVGASSLVVPETGEYFIELTASEKSYPALYVLSLSDTLSIEDAALLSRAMKESFVPNEVLIGTGESSSLSISTSKRSKNIPIIEKRRIRQNTGLYRIEADLTNKKSIIENADDNSLSQKWSTLKKIEQLKQDYPEHYVEPNYIRKATLLTNDKYFGDQWNLRMINAPEAWDITKGSPSVVVAIIDSGIDSEHEDLKGKISNLGYDFVSDVTLSGDGDGIDNDPTDLSTTKHGSHVAGIIGASSNNNKGIASVGYDTTLLPLRVLGVENEEGESTGNDADIADAIYYATNLEDESGNKIVDVINLSLGSAAESTTLKNAINAALAENIVVVAASGNDGIEQGFYPAAYEGVIAVGAVTSQGERSSFSNYGSYLDVVAPGGASSEQDFSAGEQGILSTINELNYAEYVGTSMAAPHVSGVIALIRSLNPTASNSSILSALQNGVITDQIGQSIYFGGGLINAEKAVNWALDPDSIPDELAVFPSQLAFADENTNAPLYLSNSGPGTVSIVSVGTDDSVNWIEIIPIKTNSDGLGEYTVKIKNEAIKVLTSAHIEVEYTINGGQPQTFEIPVVASITDVSNQNVGNLFISLYSESAFEDAINTGILYSDYVISANLADGVYGYSFDNVQQNNYYMRASTNNDGDRYLFDKGEAVGRYPNLSTFEFIELNKNMTGIDFEVQFLEQNFSSQKLENNKSTQLIHR